jgi:hypothetical protein
VRRKRNLTNDDDDETETGETKRNKQ